jgi:hypothetical protein
VSFKFSVEQTITADGLSAVQLANSSSFQNIVFRKALALVSGLDYTAFNVTKAVSLGRRRRMDGGGDGRRRLIDETIILDYDVEANTDDADADGNDETDAAENALETISSILITSTGDASGDDGALSTFDAALSVAATEASEVSPGHDDSVNAFATVSVSRPVGFALDTASIEVARSAFPSSAPTSMPSCGEGSELTSDECSPCSTGTYRDTNAIHKGRSCRECAIDTYAPYEGMDYCEDCSYPWATLTEGSDTCDALTLGAEPTLGYAVYAVMAVTYFAQIYFAKRDRWATAIFTGGPAADFASDVVYVMQVKFYDKYVFAAGLIVLFLSSLSFINHLRKIRATPGFFVAFPGYYVFNSVIFLSSHRYAPFIDGKPAPGDFKRHDDLMKVTAFIFLWILCVVAQAIWLVLFGIWCILHCIWWIPVLIFGMFFYQLKAVCVKRIWNIWIWLWTLDPKKFQKSIQETDTDAGLLNESIMTEFFLESIPQLLLQGLNNTATDQWDEWFTIASFSFSLGMVVNSIYRFGYYVFVMENSVDEVPIRLKIPGLALLELKPDDPEDLVPDEMDVEIAGVVKDFIGVGTGDEKKKHSSRFEHRVRKAWKDIAQEIGLNARYPSRFEHLGELLTLLQKYNIHDVDGLLSMKDDMKCLIELAEACPNSLALEEISGLKKERDEKEKAKMASSRKHISRFLRGLLGLKSDQDIADEKEEAEAARKKADEEGGDKKSSGGFLSFLFGGGGGEEEGENSSDPLPAATTQPSNQA